MSNKRESVSGLSHIGHATTSPVPDVEEMTRPPSHCLKRAGHLRVFAYG